MSKRVLITGAGGFLGRHLSAYLRARGGARLALTDLRRPAAVAGEAAYACDLSDRVAVRRLLRRVSPGVIYHLAGVFSPDREECLRANFLAARNLFESALELRPACRVLALGSAAEYGRVIRNPVGEDTPLRPFTPYGFSKMLQTRLAEYYARACGLDVVVARPFNLYGEGISERLFPGRVARQAAEFRAGCLARIEVGWLGAVRDYLHVDEAVARLAALAERGKTGEVYNVGSGRPVTMKAFMRGLLRELGVPWAAVRQGVRAHVNPGEVRRIYADVSKLKRLLRRGASR